MGITAARVATGEIEEEYVEKPKPKPNRRKGGSKGGKARAESLTLERRSEIASNAAKTRWKRREQQQQTGTFYLYGAPITA